MATRHRGLRIRLRRLVARARGMDVVSPHDAPGLVPCKPCPHIFDHVTALTEAGLAAFELRPRILRCLVNAHKGKAVCPRDFTIWVPCLATRLQGSRICLRSLVARLRALDPLPVRNGPGLVACRHCPHIFKLDSELNAFGLAVLRPCPHVFASSVHTRTKKWSVLEALDSGFNVWSLVSDAQ